MDIGRITAPPDWGWWIVFYFFLGGLAAGSYFMAALIELIGDEQDRELAKVSYYVAFPLVAICGVLLILDLGRPERFWHMIVQSETLRPMFKYWSPMSVGSWAIMLFGGLTFVSFVGVLAEDGRLGPGRFSEQARKLHRRPFGVAFELLAAGVGFFVASYTGVLLSTSNQPFWSDSYLFGPFFLVSAAATGTAMMLLLRRRSATPNSLRRLEQANAWALGLELLLFASLLISFGGLATQLIASSVGVMMLLVSGLLGLVIPLALRIAPQLLGRWSSVAANILVLIGGFSMRYEVLAAAEHLDIAGR
jgi:formate-dependent nitrite reductase membrane component NrfD